MTGSRPAGNIQLSAAVYFTGCSYSKIDHVFKTMGLQFLSSAVYYDYVQQFLQPVIFSMWDSSQKAMTHELIQRSGDVVLGADMRADSPGHSAKFGSYTVMELRSNKVIHIELVQVFVSS
jgi:solute carrier family 8 (sodium/calcium exchanger)